MRKPPLWKTCIFLSRKLKLSLIPHTIKKQHTSNSFPHSKSCEIAFLANIVTVQANNITVGKMPLGRFSHGHAQIIRGTHKSRLC